MSSQYLVRMTLPLRLPVIVTVIAVTLSGCRARDTPQASLSAGIGNPPVPKIEVVDLGAVNQFDPKTGLSETFSIDVKPNPVSIAIFVADDSPQDSYYLVTSVVGPSGEALVSGSTENLETLVATNRLGLAEAQSKNRSNFFEPGFASLLLPNNPQVSIAGGRWTFRVMGFSQAATGLHGSASHPRVTALIKRGKIKPQTRGKLALNLFFTGSSGLTAESAPNNEFYKEFIRELTAIYADARIDIEISRTQNISDEFRRVAMGEDAFFGAFRATNSSKGVNLILVEDLQLYSGKAAGFSGGIPGRPAVSGRPYAGVIVNSSMPGENERRPPPWIAAAHELGHYLGLPHTFDGVFGTAENADQFSDTPEDWSNNLMDFGLNPFAATSRGLSPQQISILLRSPAVALSTIQ